MSDISFDLTPPTEDQLQQLSASLGGPIVRNKTFFFTLFDGQRMYSRQNVVTPVLTAQARQGRFRTKDCSESTGSQPP